MPADPFLDFALRGMRTQAAVDQVLEKAKAPTAAGAPTPNPAAVSAAAGVAAGLKLDPASIPLAPEPPL